MTKACAYLLPVSGFVKRTGYGVSQVTFTRLTQFLDPHDRRLSSTGHRLTGQVVKAFASGAEDPGFESRLRQDFSWSSHTSDLKIGTPAAALPGAWRYGVSAVTGRPGVSIL